MPSLLNWVSWGDGNSSTSVLVVVLFIVIVGEECLGSFAASLLSEEVSEVSPCFPCDDNVSNMDYGQESKNYINNGSNLLIFVIGCKFSITVETGEGK